VRRLAVLKNWADQYGLSSPPATWQPVTGAVPYSTDRWQTTRHAADFDEESIGLLTIPAPGLGDLGARLRAHFNFLADLDDAEQRIAAGGAGSRSLALEGITNLPGSRFTDRLLY
jgi:uncharacterized protein